jgi:hypothetical protein
MSYLRYDIAIQPRDLKLLRTLLHTRILTLKHAACLIFNGSQEAAKKRVQKLKSAGLILERRRKAYEPGILFLSKRGFECLKQQEGLPQECATVASFSKRVQVSELTLRHEMEVIDVKVAFHEAVRGCENLFLAEFSTWPDLYAFLVKDPDEWRGGVKTVKPDGFIRLHEKEADGSTWEHLFFLEVDRSTEKLATLTDRVRLYNLFYRSGGMAEKFGKTPEDYKEFPFRVLVVCKSKERRDNIARMLLEMQPPILTQVCLSVLGEVCHDPLAHVWRLPADYAKGAAMENTGRGILELET